MNQRLTLSARRKHATQTFRISGHHTLSLSVHHDPQPAEIFHRLKTSDCSSGLIGLYDIIARLMSLALQYDAPLELVSDLLAGAKFKPRDPVSGHDLLKRRSSLSDLIGRHLLIEHCGRDDLAHVLIAAGTADTRRYTRKVS